LSTSLLVVLLLVAFAAGAISGYWFRQLKRARNPAPMALIQPDRADVFERYKADKERLSGS
jgi:uncharacterized membrane protein YpjA